MTAREYHCDRCGGMKRLFFVRGSARIAISVAFAAFVIILANAVPDGLLKSAGIYIGVVAALLPVVSLLRIRCLICEPEWKEKMWR